MELVTPTEPSIIKKIEKKKSHVNSANLVKFHSKDLINKKNDEIEESCPSSTDEEIEAYNTAMRMNRKRCLTKEIDMMKKSIKHLQDELKKYRRFEDCQYEEECTENQITEMPDISEIISRYSNKYSSELIISPNTPGVLDASDIRACSETVSRINLWYKVIYQLYKEDKNEDERVLGDIFFDNIMLIDLHMNNDHIRKCKVEGVESVYYNFSKKPLKAVVKIDKIYIAPSIEMLREQLKKFGYEYSDIAWKIFIDNWNKFNEHDFIFIGKIKDVDTSNQLYIKNMNVLRVIFFIGLIDSKWNHVINKQETVLNTNTNENKNETPNNNTDVININSSNSMRSISLKDGTFEELINHLQIDERLKMNEIIEQCFISNENNNLNHQEKHQSLLHNRLTIRTGCDRLILLREALSPLKRKIFDASCHIICHLNTFLKIFKDDEAHNTSIYYTNSKIFTYPFKIFNGFSFMKQLQKLQN